jgi:hypothetical protein
MICLFGDRLPRAAWLRYGAEAKLVDLRLILAAGWTNR